MQEYFKYLDQLKKQGIVTVFNAEQYLTAKYGNLNESEVRNIVVQWDTTYAERNPILLEE